MAKRGQVQLQIELNSDSEWQHFLQRKGLIVVDVYSDWCGPCLAMSANLKKIKLELGGDMLHLALAKADNIADLERFRNKSEPTWMFLSDGKVVNLVFGANAPQLTRLLIEELKHQKAAMEKNQPRQGMEVTALSAEEQQRKDIADAKARLIKEKEDAKRAAELRERRIDECKNLLENLQNFGVILVLPKAIKKYKDVLGDHLTQAGVVINQTEKIQVTEKLLEELLYFDEIESLNDESIDEILQEICVVLLMKPASRGDSFEDADKTMLTLVYGESQQPPGSEGSPGKEMYDASAEEDEKKKSLDSRKSDSRKGSEPLIPEEQRRISNERRKTGELRSSVENRKTVEDEETSYQKKSDIDRSLSLWVPPNSCVRAAALKLFFPKVSSTFAFPDLEPEPPSIIVIFNYNDKDAALQTREQYESEVKHYGFFDNDDPYTAKLVARNLKEYEKLRVKTKEEKLVMQVSKKKSECIFAFAQLSPLYMSTNATEGKEESELFFPEDYIDELPEEEPAEGEGETEGEGNVEVQVEEESKLTVALDETATVEGGSGPVESVSHEGSAPEKSSLSSHPRSIPDGTSQEKSNEPLEAEVVAE